MPPKRPHKRTNSLLVANRARAVLYLTVKWKPKPVTIDTIRQAVQEKARE